MGACCAAWVVEGTAIGPDQRIDVQGVRGAMTLDAAGQIHHEQELSSTESGQ